MAMPLLEWKDSFEIGIDSIDFEHREMVDLINELHDRLGADATTAEVMAFFGEIYAKISAHFALEEEVMRRLHYDELEAHKEDHEALLDDIRDIMDAYQSGKYLDYQGTLSEHLRVWFGDHFQTKDARLHRILGV